MQKLRRLFIALWLGSAYPQLANGTRYTRRTPLVCCGAFTAALLMKASEAMQENLTDKYGIRQIEADDE
ncbi:hypothetical protein RWE87_02140 [Sinorhizobium meliloti]